MKKILIFLVFSFLVKFCYTQIKNDTISIPCGYFAYFKGYCYDSIHVVKLKSVGGYISCKIYTDNVKPNKEGKYDPNYLSIYQGYDSVIFILDHRLLPNTKMYRLIFYSETCDRICLQPKNLRIDCEKSPP